MPLTTVNPAMIGQTSTGAASLTATGSAAASLVTAAGTALSADSSGRVTMPFQVSFSAIANAVQNTTIPFGNAATYSNVGSGLNTSTGVFTAPVAGTYLFTTNSLSNGGQADMQLSINGVYRASCRGNSTTASMSLIYTMAAGDTARVVTNGVQAYGDSSGWSIFNGRLIG